jgi:hypothetical protein
MQAAELFMIDEFVIFYDIKKNLLEQNAKQILDVHLGKYDFEEGEIVELWEPEEVDAFSRRIMQYKIENLRIQKYKDEEYDEEYEEEEYEEYEEDEEEEKR